MIHDLRVATRSLIQRPGFAALSDSHARAGDRCQHDDVQPGGCGAAPATPVREVGSTGDAVGCCRTAACDSRRLVPRSPGLAGDEPHLCRRRHLRRNVAESSSGHGGDSRGIRNGVGRLLQPARRARRARPYVPATTTIAFPTSGRLPSSATSCGASDSALPPTSCSVRSS